MRILQKTTEADMIATFLKGEIVSFRFGHVINAQLERDHKDLRLIEAPDITNVQENAYRRYLLTSYRSYIFDELPATINWYRAFVERDELHKVRYSDYDYWNEISAQTRLPVVATETIRAGREIYKQSNQQFLEAAQALRAGAQFSELIVLGISPDAPLTVYEGHLRLTAYLLAPECIPEELAVVVGFAPECARI